MGELAVRAVGLSKDYRLGALRGGATLRDKVVSLSQAPVHLLRGRRRPPPELVEALHDLTFDVAAGEAVGFLGHNGAGKSTLLKVLSRITEPTRGYAEVHGRVGSLLEVGTGFHPELTGRENVYLNGAILGMRRAEIARRFEEIVAFAEVERFIDTQVKRYSSGMYVRLAFAVAAHLEPEVLIVDEVLAVGDAAFQRKSLGRMGDVAREGRTVLFVSHNMSVVQSLCTRALVLDRGRVVVDAPAAEAAASYLSRLERNAESDLEHRVDRYGYYEVHAVSCAVVAAGGGALSTGQPMTICVQVSGLQPDLTCRLVLSNQLGQPVATLDSGVRAAGDLSSSLGLTFTCVVEELALRPGRYRVDVLLHGRGHVQDDVHGAAFFDVEDGSIDGRPAGRGLPGDVALQHRWTVPEL